MLISIGRAQKMQSQKPSEKYGKYCYSIAYNILSNAEDADESVNDTYLDAWHNMPPPPSDHALYILGKNHPQSIH